MGVSLTVQLGGHVIDHDLLGVRVFDGGIVVGHEEALQEEERTRTRLVHWHSGWCEAGGGEERGGVGRGRVYFSIPYETSCEFRGLLINPWRFTYE